MYKVRINEDGPHEYANKIETKRTLFQTTRSSILIYPTSLGIYS